MAGILALLLAFSFYFYNPTWQTTSEISISGSTVNEIADKFMYTSINYSKSNSDMLLSRANNIIQTYEDNPNTVEYFDSYINTINDSAKTFILNIKASVSESEFNLRKSTIENNRLIMLNSANSLLSLYDTYLHSTNTLFLVTKTDNVFIQNRITQLIERLEATGIKDYLSYELMKNYLEDNNGNPDGNFKIAFGLKFDDITSVTLSGEFLEELRTLYTDEATIRLADTFVEINSFLTSEGIDSIEQQSSLSNKNALNSYISKYYNIALQTFEIIESAIIIEISNSFSTEKFNEFYGITNFNDYQINQSFTRQQYLFDNNELEYNYANALTFNNTSNAEPNAFDFMYYVLELFSFVIIIYCVVLGSSMIAGEQSNGTLKLLAIRPYKRSKILASKILATMFFVSIFVIFSSLITLIAGGAMYGFASQPILAVYNASIAFVISPIAMFGIYLLCLFLKIFVFVMLAFAISTLFKSYVGAVTISMLSFFATSLLSVFLSNSFIFKFFPLNNLDLFKYFGGGIFADEVGNSLLNLFQSPILSGTNFTFSALSLLVTSAVLIILTFAVFKKRDIA